MKHVLFVCTANIDRSRTAQDFFREQFPQFRFSSAGTSQKATLEGGTQFLTQPMLDEADLILVMEEKHQEWIEMNHKVDPIKIKVLQIPDTYTYYSLELIEVLQQKCAPFLL